MRTNDLDIENTAISSEQEANTRMDSPLMSHAEYSNELKNQSFGDRFNITYNFQNAVTSSLDIDNIATSNNQQTNKQMQPLSILLAQHSTEAIHMNAETKTMIKTSHFKFGSDAIQQNSSFNDDSFNNVCRVVENHIEDDINDSSEASESQSNINSINITT